MTPKVGLERRADARCSEARQLVRMKIMPTERSMPAVSTTKVCAIATKASSTPLLAAVCDDIGAEAGRVVAGVDREHQDEDGERQQGAALLAEAR